MRKTNQVVHGSLCSGPSVFLLLIIAPLAVAPVELPPPSLVSDAFDRQPTPPPATVDVPPSPPAAADVDRPPPPLFCCNCC